MFGDGFTHGSPVSSYQSRRSQPASGITESDTGIFRSAATRSEEHTSELQSRLHLVCRLLLEKKTQVQALHATGGPAQFSRKLWVHTLAARTAFVRRPRPLVVPFAAIKDPAHLRWPGLPHHVCTTRTSLHPTRAPGPVTGRHRAGPGVLHARSGGRLPRHPERRRLCLRLAISSPTARHPFFFLFRRPPPCPPLFPPTTLSR